MVYIPIVPESVIESLQEAPITFIMGYVTTPGDMGSLSSLLLNSDNDGDQNNVYGYGSKSSYLASSSSSKYQANDCGGGGGGNGGGSHHVRTQSTASNYTYNERNGGCGGGNNTGYGHSRDLSHQSQSYPPQCSGYEFDGRHSAETKNQNQHSSSQEDEILYVNLDTDELFHLWDDRIRLPYESRLRNDLRKILYHDYPMLAREIYLDDEEAYTIHKEECVESIRKCFYHWFVTILYNYQSFYINDGDFNVMAFRSRFSDACSDYINRFTETSMFTYFIEKKYQEKTSVLSSSSIKPRDYFDLCSNRLLGIPFFDKPGTLERDSAMNTLNYRTLLLDPPRTTTGASRNPLISAANFNYNSNSNPTNATTATTTAATTTTTTRNTTDPRNNGSSSTTTTASSPLKSVITSSTSSIPSTLSLTTGPPSSQLLTTATTTTTMTTATTLSNRDILGMTRESTDTLFSSPATTMAMNLSTATAKAKDKGPITTNAKTNRKSHSNPNAKTNVKAKTSTTMATTSTNTTSRNSLNHNTNTNKSAASAVTTNINAATTDKSSSSSSSSVLTPIANTTVTTTVTAIPSSSSSGMPIGQSTSRSSLMTSLPLETIGISGGGGGGGEESMYYHFDVNLFEYFNTRYQNNNVAALASASLQIPTTSLGSSLSSSSSPSTTLSSTCSLASTMSLSTSSSTSIPKMTKVFPLLFRDINQLIDRQIRYCKSLRKGSVDNGATKTMIMTLTKSKTKTKSKSKSNKGKNEKENESKSKGKTKRATVRMTTTTTATTTDPVSLISQKANGDPKVQIDSRTNHANENATEVMVENDHDDNAVANKNENKNENNDKENDNNSDNDNDNDNDDDDNENDDNDDNDGDDNDNTDAATAVKDDRYSIATTYHGLKEILPLARYRGGYSSTTMPMSSPPSASSSSHRLAIDGAPSTTANNGASKTCMTATATTITSTKNSTTSLTSQKKGDPSHGHESHHGQGPVAGVKTSNPGIAASTTSHSKSNVSLSHGLSLHSTTDSKPKASGVNASLSTATTTPMLSKLSVNAETEMDHGGTHGNIASVSKSNNSIMGSYHGSNSNSNSNINGNGSGNGSGSGSESLAAVMMQTKAAIPAECRSRLQQLLWIRGLLLQEYSLDLFQSLEDFCWAYNFSENETLLEMVENSFLQLSNQQKCRLFKKLGTHFFLAFEKIFMYNLDIRTMYEAYVQCTNME